MQVQDAGGNAVAGKAVTFAVVSGGGSLSVTSGVSDASGNLSTVWTLGATVGRAVDLGDRERAHGLAAHDQRDGGGGAQPHLLDDAARGRADGGRQRHADVVVTARDATNNSIPTFTGTVTLAIGTNPGGATSAARERAARDHAFSSTRSARA